MAALTHKQFRTVTLVCSAWLVFWSLILYLGNRPLFHRGEILSRGVPATAAVQAKWISKGSYRVQVNFSAASGSSHSHSLSWYPEDYAQVKIGDLLPVHYLKEDPDLYAIDSNSPDFSTLIQVALVVFGVPILVLVYFSTMCFKGRGRGNKS